MPGNPLDTLWPLFQVLWPPAVVAIAVKGFPETIGKIVTKGIDERSEARIVRLKDELARETSLKVDGAKSALEASYLTLQTSVDFLSTGQSGMREHIVSAVITLWSAIGELTQEFGGIVSFEMIFAQEEIRRAIEGNERPKILVFVEKFRDRSATTNASVNMMRRELHSARLFCGDRLWLVFFVTRAVYMRLGYLMVNSLNDRKYYPWRNDIGIPSLLAGVLSEEEMKCAVADDMRGLNYAMNLLEAHFLREASRVMSGSKAMADSLSDTQAMLLLRTNQVTQARADAEGAERSS